MRYAIVIEKELRRSGRDFAMAIAFSNLGAIGLILILLSSFYLWER